MDELKGKVMKQSKVIDTLQNENKEKDERMGKMEDTIQLLEGVSGLMPESKVKVRFDQCDSNEISITNNGTSIKRIKRGGNHTQCIYASKGFNEGIKYFKIQTDQSWYGSNGIGVVPKIYNGEECKGKHIDTDNGIPIYHLSSNDIILVILNFNESMLYFMVNGVLKKQDKLVNNKTYYPCIRFSNASESLNTSCRVSD